MAATVQTPVAPALAPKRLADLPGLPLMGNLLQVDRERMHLQLEAWSRTYGDTFRIRLASREFLVVANPEAIAAALRDRPGAIGRTGRLVSVAAEMGFEGVFASNGETWRRQRPMVMAGFDPAHIKTYFPSLVNVTERFARRWQRAATQGKPIDLTADLMRFTVDVITGLAFGADLNTLEKDDDVIQQHLDQIFPAIFKRLIAPVMYWRHVKLPADRRLDVHLNALSDAVQGFIAKARARVAANPALRESPTNLIEAMVVARDQPGSGLSDADVAGNVLTMLLAGEDTTANTLAWMIYLLWRNPDALALAQAEVRGVLGDDTVPTRLEQLHAMDYVEACAHETMRLKPVAPTIANQAMRDTVVAGVAMPAGSLMMFLMRGGALDERHFPEPQRFDPTRWMKQERGQEGAPANGQRGLQGSEPARGPADAGSAKRVAMPFGAGPRICPGRYLALLEMKMAMAMLLARFDIVAVETPEGGEAQEKLSLTMSPVGLSLRLKMRSQLR